MSVYRSARPRVTVLLPVYDAARHLDEAIESILAQTWRDLELLAVDDGSRDDSVERLEAHARRDSRVRIVRRSHEGVTATLNAGLALARGDLVARMDADDVALPRRLEFQVAMLDREPEIVCVGCAYEVIDEKGRRISVVRPPCSPAEVEAAALEGRSPIIHSGALFRRDRVLSIGGYDASVPVAQDYDLWLRLMDGSKLANLPDVALRVRYTPQSVSGTRQQEQTEVVRRLCAAARARRGIPGNPELRPWRPVPDWRSRQRFALSWSLSAWRLGERRTALHYALRAVAIQPFSAELLRALGHGLLRGARRALRGAFSAKRREA
jgi:cellulose synthase/poly-beta-1,6-N-acetylglucosamine synthase-like glycosyltransferase